MKKIGKKILFIIYFLYSSHSFEKTRYVNTVKWQANTGTETINNGDTVAIDLMQPDGLTFNNATNYYSITGATFNQNLGNTTYQNGTQAQNFYIRLPDVSAGLWLIRLATDNYYSCALINITETQTPVYQVGPGSTIDSTDPTYSFTPGQSTFFQVTYPAMTGLLARATGPVSTPITVSIGMLSNTDPNQLPGAGTNPGPVYDTVTTAIAPSPTSTVSVGTCANGMANNAITYVVGVAVDAGITTESYSVEFNANNQVRLNVPDANRSITYTHENYLYFYTEAASGLDGDIRIHLTVPSTADQLPTEFSGATNCQFSAGTFSSVTTSAGNTICLDVPKTQGVKYIKVSAMTSNYLIGAQKGTCSNINSGVATSVSLLVVLIALILSMF